MNNNSTHPSTVSLQSSTTITSTTPLTSFKSDDSSTSVVKQPSMQKMEPSSVPSSSTVPLASQPKDFEAAFGKLSSSYGYGGQMPILPRKKVDKKSKPKKSGSLFSSGGEAR